MYSGKSSEYFEEDIKLEVNDFENENKENLDLKATHFCDFCTHSFKSKKTISKPY